MLKKIIKIFLVVFSLFCTLAVILMIYFNLSVKNVENKSGIGVTFSSRYSEEIGLNWKENYLAILDDLKIRKIRIPAYWDLIESKEGEYDFSDVDWQIEEAQKRNAEIILVIGQKVPRWPECFIPSWAESSDQKRKEALLEFVENSAEHFKKFPGIKYWQIENEPFLDFGVCPKADYNLIDREIEIVRNVDSSRKIIVTDSGELSFWIPAAKRADIFGTTMYREVVSKKFGSIEYPIGPNFFKFKNMLIRSFADQENSIVVELQGEPWLNGTTTSFSVQDQLNSMNSEKLEDNVQFAKNSGFSEIYLWGAEWWYYLKIKQSHPEVWNMAKNIIDNNK